MYVLYIQCILEWDFPFCNFAKCIVYTEYVCMCMCMHIQARVRGGGQGDCPPPRN